MALMTMNFLTKVLSSTALQIPKYDIHRPIQFDESPGWLGTPWLGTLIMVVVSGEKTIML